MPQLFNDALDDAPADDFAGGWAGADFATHPVLLPPEMISDGRNVHAAETGHLVTRPGLRWLTLCHEGSLSDPTRSAPQGIAYYDTPAAERLVVVRDGQLYQIAGDSPSAPTSLVSGAPTLPTSGAVRFAQLVDLLFYTDGSSSLRWAKLDGAWTHGAVATFNGGAAMPAWAGVAAHRLRLFAWPADGSRLYASSIGAASTAADWQQTDNLRFGVGEGDPIVAVLPGQSQNLIVLTQSAAYAVDTTAPAVADWTITAITHLAGCVAPATALAFGQDVLFLSRYGVMTLGALSDNISINPATAISAPMQPIIDRINWTRIDRAHATVWRDLYLLALPLDQDEWPSTWLTFNIRTRRWQAPWTAPLGAIPLGDLGEATLLAAEDGSLLVNEDPAAIQTTGTPPGSPIDVLLAEGWSAACTSRFGGRQETILADSAGRIVRIDPTLTKDDATPSYSQEIVSWATLKSFDLGSPANPKQPFNAELVFQESTATGVRLLFVPDDAVAFPDIALAEGIEIDGGFTTGETGGFPLVFPLRFRPNTQTRKRWHIRHLPRFRDAALQIYSTRGRMRLRSAGLSAFVDSPEIA